jgi:WD40 repeat protein
MNKRYDFMGIDEGKQNLFRGDTLSGKIHWIKSLEDYPTARAMQRLDDDTILLGYERGYCIVEISKGNVIHDCSRWENVTSAYRCDDGTTLLTGLDLNGKNGVCVITLDNNDQIIHTAVQEGDYVRLMTVSDDKKYLLSTNDHVTICDRELNTEKNLSVEGFLHAWQTKIMPDRSLLVSAGYGAFITRFSYAGDVLSTFGKIGQVPEEVEPNFYAAIDIADDGNILVANWQGHGPDNGSKGRQLILFSSDGEFLDSWSFGDKISSFQGLLLL